MKGYAVPRKPDQTYEFYKIANCGPNVRETTPLLVVKKFQTVKADGSEDLKDPTTIKECFQRERRTSHIVLTVLSLVLTFLFFPFSLVLSLKVVREYQRAIILRLGVRSSSKPEGPGLIFFLPCIDVVHIVDQRITSYSIPPQQILTKDSVTVQVDAVVYFYIQDPVASVLQAENARNSTYRVAQGTLRDILGTKSLAQILSDREEISERLHVNLTHKHSRTELRIV